MITVNNLKSLKDLPTICGHCKEACNDNCRILDEFKHGELGNNLVKLSDIEALIKERIERYKPYAEDWTCEKAIVRLFTELLGSDVSDDEEA